MGQQLIETFLHKCAGLGNNWDASSIIEDQVAKIREKVGDAQVICGLSGGVDSAVAAALVHKAIGDQLTCVFVDHGLLRKGEAEQVKHDSSRPPASSSSPWTPPKTSSPREGRERAGEEAQDHRRKVHSHVREGSAPGHRRGGCFRQGSQVPRSGHPLPGCCGIRRWRRRSNIKSHHNVGGLPDDIKFQLVEPLRTLFKDEVRAIGTELGLPDEIVWRQPFPGPGLGIRIIGEITKERLDLLREADAIAREELSKAGLDRDIWQCRSCSLPMCIPWVCRATSARMVRQSCCVRFPPKTP